MVATSFHSLINVLNFLFIYYECFGLYPTQKSMSVVGWLIQKDHNYFVCPTKFEILHTTSADTVEWHTTKS